MSKKCIAPPPSSQPVDVEKSNARPELYDAFSGEKRTQLIEQLVELLTIANEKALFEAADFVRDCILKSGGKRR